MIEDKIKEDTKSLFMISKTSFILGNLKSSILENCFYTHYEYDDVTNSSPTFCKDEWLLFHNDPIGASKLILKDN